MPPFTKDQRPLFARLNKCPVDGRYTWALIKGVLATLAFAIGAHAAARQGAGLWSVLGVGYLSWLVAWAALQTLL